MNTHQSLAAAMRRALLESAISEVDASGEFTLPALKPTLFPGAVYGFAVHLNKNDLKSLFEEAQARGLSRIAKLENIHPIEGTLYPLYWGKDKQLGARPYQHLNDPTKTGAIRLSTYKSLSGKAIFCATLVVSDYVAAEGIIQKAYPDMLKNFESQTWYLTHHSTRTGAIKPRQPVQFRR